MGRASSRLLAAVLMSAVASVSAACSPSEPDTPPARSAVGIEAAGCSLVPAVASGVAVERTGRVVTVAHAVAGADSVTVIDIDGQRWPGVVVHVDPASDLAIIDVAPNDDKVLPSPPLPIRRAESGDDATIVAWGRRSGIVATQASVERHLDVTIEDIYIEAEVERTAIEITGEISAGDSGGPVIVDGAVAGIIYARARSGGRGFALDDRELTDALETIDDDAMPIETGRCTP